MTYQQPRRQNRQLRLPNRNITKRLQQIFEKEKMKITILGVTLTTRVQDTEEGSRIVLSKGKKWLAIPSEDTDETELFKLICNFDNEWQTRVGQNLED